MFKQADVTGEVFVSCWRGLTNKRQKHKPSKAVCHSQEGINLKETGLQVWATSLLLVGGDDSSRHD